MLVRHTNREISGVICWETEERKILTKGKTYKIFITEQVGGYWVATVLYADNGKVITQNELARSRDEAYQQAEQFVRDSIDAHAEIQPLDS